MKKPKLLDRSDRFIKNIVMVLVTLRRFKQLNFSYPNDQIFKHQVVKHIEGLRKLYFNFLTEADAYDSLTILEIERVCGVASHGENIRFITENYRNLTELDTRMVEQLLSLLCHSIYHKDGFSR